MNSYGENEFLLVEITLRQDANIHTWDDGIRTDLLKFAVVALFVSRKA